MVKKINKSKRIGFPFSARKLGELIREKALPIIRRGVKVNSDVEDLLVAAIGEYWGSSSVAEKEKAGVLEWFVSPGFKEWSDEKQKEAEKYKRAWEGIFKRIEKVESSVFKDGRMTSWVQELIRCQREHIFLFVSAAKGRLYRGRFEVGHLPPEAKPRKDLSRAAKVLAGQVADILENAQVQDHVKITFNLLHDLKAYTGTATKRVLLFRWRKEIQSPLIR
jgi:hypothetical protein